MGGVGGTSETDGWDENRENRIWRCGSICGETLKIEKLKLGMSLKEVRGKWELIIGDEIMGMKVRRLEGGCFFCFVVTFAQSKKYGRNTVAAVALVFAGVAQSKASTDIMIAFCESNVKHGRASFDIEPENS